MNQHQRNKVNTAALILGSLGVVLSAIGLAVAIPQGPTTSASAKPMQKPVSLKGTWHQVKGMPGTEMTAEISGDSIQIDLKIDESHGVFWMGSFDTSDKTGDKFTVTSLPDPDAKKALKNSLFGDSAETHKRFTYNHGDLSFEFSMMGVESTVHLTRGK